MSFSEHQAAWRDPFAITPSDSTNFSKPTTGGIYVGTGGAIVAVLSDSTTLTVTGVAGTVIPIVAIRVNSTGTVATGLVGLTN